MLRAFTGLIAFCLLLRAMIPVGFMPDLAAARDGVFTLVICTGNGLSTVELDANGDPVDPDDRHEAETQNHCTFAPIGPVVLTTRPADLALQAFASAAASWSSIPAAGHIRYRPTALLPRAPPLRS